MYKRKAVSVKKRTQLLTAAIKALAKTPKKSTKRKTTRKRVVKKRRTAMSRIY